MKSIFKFQGLNSANEEKAAAAMFARKLDVDVNGEAMLVCTPRIQFCHKLSIIDTYDIFN